ncbi:MAG: hypothetical protein N2C12_08330, partial [Planctomycetales bacterium]
MATLDGGRTWQKQRDGGSRAALLGIFADETQVPLELFARLSAGEGYLSSVLLIGRYDVDRPTPTFDMPDRRIREALTAAGACSVEQAWRFPLFQPGLNKPGQQIVGRWAALHEQPAEKLLEQAIARHIQIWRPDVIVTGPISPRSDNAVARLLNQAVLKATQLAARPPADSNGQDTELASWKVSKIYGVLPARSVGTVNIATSQLIPNLGRSLSDFCSGPRSLLEKNYSVGEPTLRFQLLLDDLPQGQGRRDIFSGLNLQPGNPARRELLHPPNIDVHELQRAANRRQVIKAIVAAAGRGRQSTKAWLGQIGQITGGLGSMAAGDVLYHLA